MFIYQNRDVMNHHFHALKSQMKSMQDSMRKNLTTLTLQSDHCLGELTKKEETVSLTNSSFFVQNIYI